MEVSEEYRKEILETLKLLGGDDYSLNGTGRKKIKDVELLKKNYPKSLPVVPFGKIITDQEQLKHLYLETYLHRLRRF